jgi:tetratricopeptide (TPR) repeat protein
MSLTILSEKTKSMGKYNLNKKYSYQTTWIFIAFCFILSHSANAQKTKADSLISLLSIEKSDTIRIKLLWKLGDVMSIYNTDSALLVSQQALFLSKRIHYIEGQSRSLGIMANTFSKMGNYPRALQSNIEKLQLEEKRNMPRNLASVLMNIGTVYNLQEEYRKALEYYFKSDAVINSNGLNDLSYYITLNLGDTYNHLNIADSAFIYFDKSLQIAFKLNEGDFIGTSLTGIAQTYFKQNNYSAALTNFQSAINYLKAANDDDVLCEATLSLAKLYHETNNKDSATYYAALSNTIAQNAGFTSRQLDAVSFLTNHFKEANELDSALLYMTFLKQLNDTINSRTRIKEVQLISINEQLRQQEIEEQKKIAKKERGKQLQLLFIGIFIPGFFLLTLLLSRIKIHIKLVKVLGILSLLILFEYLTLLLHPYVLKLTNYTPVYEMLIFVSIAAFLIPTHHRIEHWVIHMLTRNHSKGKSKKIVIKTMKIKIKNPSG